MSSYGPLNLLAPNALMSKQIYLYPLALIMRDLTPTFQTTSA